MFKFMLSGVGFLYLTGAAHAVPVNLSSWSVEDGPGFFGGGISSWNLSADNNSVTQRVNSRVSVFSNGSSSSQGTSLSGSIRVNGALDDDFIGFVFGFDAGEMNGSASSVDYWLVDWKQGTQNHAGTIGNAGLALSHVTGATTNANDFWGHQGVVSEVARGTSLGSTGWADLTDYTFKLVFTASLIQVYVNGALEISQSGSFGDGGFGFYNFSQPDVTYAGITENVVAPVPLPAGLPLLAGAIGLLGFAKRRKG